MQVTMKKRVRFAVSELANSARTKDRNPERHRLARLAFNAVKVEQAIDYYQPLSFADRQRLAAMLLDGGA